jgi:hypothetical protein
MAGNLKGAMMTIKELYDLVASEMPDNAGKEVKIWLPGSRITLNHGPGTMIAQGNVLMIEGNLEPGSALMKE